MARKVRAAHVFTPIANFVRWHCLAGHPEWANTDMVFSTSLHRGGTALRFAHRGWESSEGILAQCSYDWARYLSSLKSYLETGTGSPHRADIIREA